MKVLYLHGFASSPRSAKLVALQRVLGSDIELSSPDLNAPSFEKLDFEAMMKRALDEARRVPPDVIAGSSLGGIVALELVRRGVLAPLILLAPAVGIGERWASTLEPGDPIEVFNHARNAQALIHRAFFEQIASVRPESEPPATRVIAFMGRKDESVPFDWVRGVWESWTKTEKLVAGSMFIEIAGGDHGLVAYVDMIAREIRGAVT
ncbi:MAG: YqiA/YcfP family alpha/beta fold hydrolase [Thermoanaerobaculia bacterium]